MHLFRMGFVMMLVGASAFAVEFDPTDCAQSLFHHTIPSKRLGSLYWDYSRFDSRIPDIRKGQGAEQLGISLNLGPFLRALHTSSPSARVVGFENEGNHLYISLERDWFPSGSSQSVGQILVFDLSKHQPGMLLHAEKHIALPSIPTLPQVVALQPRGTYYRQLSDESARISRVVPFMNYSALLVGWRHRGVQAVAPNGADLAPWLFSRHDRLARAIVEDQTLLGTHQPPRFPDWALWHSASGDDRTWVAPILDPHLRTESFVKDPELLVIQADDFLSAD